MKAQPKSAAPKATVPSVGQTWSEDVGLPFELESNSYVEIMTLVFSMTQLCVYYSRFICKRAVVSAIIHGVFTFIIECLFEVST